MAQVIHVSTRGPLFTGVAEAELAATVTAVQREIAEYAEYQWQMNMTASFQHPSDPPRYQSHVNVHPRGSDLVVDDGYPGSGLLYGPWLEGVGSRNATSRFKGYFALRRAASSVAQKTAAIAAPIISAFTRKANGG
ncbi:MAG: hypothetical protein E6J20_19405 [Chloroflexi bacterium]|nr:MAG: hypothetical protein E6J20_19405 [Chloroflexota bacterium]